MNMLRSALLERRMRQYELARELGVSETRISRICCGRIDPTDAEKRQIARILRLPASALFAETSSQGRGGRSRGAL